MSSAIDETAEAPSWMIELEKKRKKIQERSLAHDIGAGAQCLMCKDACSGLDLHFWRKICRSCKCKKEAHDVKDETIHEQFDILFGNSNKVESPTRLNLKHKLEEIIATKTAEIGKDNLGTNITNENVNLDWIPSDTPADLASEYFQQLPVDKLPITGSSGAIFRRQQLQKQLPLHDLKMSHSKNPTAEETKAFEQYVNDVKTNAVGVGKITKIGNKSANLEPLISINTPKNLNFTPKPFYKSNEALVSADNLDNDLPPPPPELLYPSTDLKPPSAFIPSRSSSPNRNFDIRNNDHNANQKTEGSLFTDPSNSQTTEQFEKLSLGEKSSNHPSNTPDDKSGHEKFKASDLIRKFNSNPSSIDKIPQNTMANRAPTRISPETYNKDLSSSKKESPKKVEHKFVQMTKPEEFMASSSLPSSNKQIPLISQPLTNTTANHPAQDTSMQGTQRDYVYPEKEIYCYQCQNAVSPGQVVVVAEHLGKETIWHPQCFVCASCKEMLQNLVYFYHDGKVYCGRDYAQVRKIPRCFACDELIFVKEYTEAENQTYHVEHFCCFECDTELAGQSYISKDGNPVCLPCYEMKYGKKCNSCKQTIGASLTGVAWKTYTWHANPLCFKCETCHKSLINQKFTMQDGNPYCSSQCRDGLLLQTDL